MSTGCLKKPSRPPPPPPAPSSVSRSSNHASSNSLFSSYPSSNHRKSNSRGDYIKISDCHSGIPQDKPFKSALKSRGSTSFSSTLKPSASSYLHSSHQKSRSLTDNHLGSSYLYLDLPSNSKNNQPSPASIVYKTVDFMKTDALTKCKFERTSGRA